MRGRLYHMNVLAIVGNGKVYCFRRMTTQLLRVCISGNGLFGVGIGKSPMFKTNLAIVAAIKAASKRLMYIHRLEDRTIYQDFFAEATFIPLIVLVMFILNKF
jgi:ribosomal protein S5